jgi:23S rRNA pseudouridine1911/1915/1917 synthase
LVDITNTVIIELGELFKNKEIKKTYFAISFEIMNTIGLINFLIDKKIDKTKFEVLETVISDYLGYLNFVKLGPKTIKKRQLRKHIFEIGNSILSDKKYFLLPLILIRKGIFLHAAI